VEQHLLKNYFSHLICKYVIDFHEISFIRLPKKHLCKVTFRQPNCSSMDIRRRILHDLPTKPYKWDSKNVVKSEEQTHCDSSALGDDSEFALRYSTYIAATFQFLMARRIDLNNARGLSNEMWTSQPFTC